jgi:hypothetical protein
MLSTMMTIERSKERSRSYADDFSRIDEEIQKIHLSKLTRSIE